MKALVTWGTKLGGTEGIAAILGETLRREGYEVDLVPAARASDPAKYDAVIVGGGLYANRWHRDARRFVSRNLAALRRRPVWLFASGPLDTSADRGTLPAVRDVETLAQRVGAIGCTTFGGRLARDAKGFPAAAIAKTSSGDWRNPERIRAWAAEIAAAIPHARPRSAIDPPARALSRLLAYGCLTALACVALLVMSLAITRPSAALAIHNVIVPIVYTSVAIAYFRPRGARAAAATAGVWALALLFGDSALTLVRPELVGRFASGWLPAIFAFAVTWIVGALMATLPWPEAKPASATT